AFAQENNIELLSTKGISIWLDCPLEMVARRVAGLTHRPLARDPEAFRALYRGRRESYARADHRVEVHSDDCAEAVQQILALGLVCARVRSTRCRSSGPLWTRPIHNMLCCGTCGPTGERSSRARLNTS